MEILKLLLPQCSDLSRVRTGGKPDLTAEDIAAALARLPKEASLYGRFLILNDQTARRRLVPMICGGCAELGFDYHSSKDFASPPYVDGRPIYTDRLVDLVNLALDESHGRHKCPRGNGVGQIGVQRCDHCSGSGVRRPTESSRADALGIARGKFKKTWQHRYENIVLPVLTYLEMEFSVVGIYLK